MNGKPSSLVRSDVQRPAKDQLMMPTWGMIVFLIICFFILKSFVYIKDEKRHGK